MTDEQNVAYINAQVACALITAMGMMAQNQRDNLNQEYPQHNQSAFEALIDNFGISHNAVIECFRR